MSLPEALFLLVVWTWLFSVILFLRNTVLPRASALVLPSHLGLPAELVYFQATDGLRLSGWKIPSDAARPWIILCHGLGTNRADVLDEAAALFRARFNVLLFDFRGHGGSHGRTTSFGWLEQRDLEGALAFLGAQPDVAPRPYGVFGLSMGGAVAVMVAARDERIGALAVNSIYADLERAIAARLKREHRLPRVPFAFFVDTAYWLRFGVWPGRISPRRAIGCISPRPVLLIHGRDDPKIPSTESELVFAAAGDPKELWVVPGAVHLDGLRLAPAVYHQKLVEFFETHLM